MATLSIPAPAENAFDSPHRQLTEAHLEAKKCAQSLNTSLAVDSEINWPDAWKKTIQLAEAMQRIAEAERACGCCSGRDHIFSGPYMEMLEHHRYAYLDLERVTRKLTNNHLHSREAVSALATDLEHRLDAAEKAHQASLDEKRLSNGPISQVPRLI